MNKRQSHMNNRLYVSTFSRESARHNVATAHVAKASASSVAIADARACKQQKVKRKDTLFILWSKGNTGEVSNAGCYHSNKAM
jgi:nitrous oxide reductase